MPYLMRRATETKTALSSVMLQKRLMNAELWRRMQFWNKEKEEGDGVQEEGEQSECCKKCSKYCAKFKFENLSEVLPDQEKLSDLLETAKSLIPVVGLKNPCKYKEDAMYKDDRTCCEKFQDRVEDGFELSKICGVLP